MTTTQINRWERIKNHCLADPDLFPIFYNKLKAQNNWNDAFAIAAIEEYMRFLFLCTVMDSPTTPSQAVDEVWHLHLQFSKDYWNDLCPNIIEMQLHHQPALAGEHQKMVEQYNNTLIAYQQYFEEEPPKDIWPTATERFGIKNENTINLDANYVLSKMAVKKAIVLAVFMASILVAINMQHGAAAGIGFFASVVAWPRPKHKSHATVSGGCGTVFNCGIGCGGDGGGCGGDGGCGGGCGGCS